MLILLQGLIPVILRVVFGTAGESDCRSIGIWQNSNPPYYDGFWYFNIVGNTNGETISFKIYHGTTDSIYNCLETIPFEDGAMIGDPIILSLLRLVLLGLTLTMYAS